MIIGVLFKDLLYKDIFFSTSPKTKLRKLYIAVWDKVACVSGGSPFHRQNAVRTVWPIILQSTLNRGVTVKVQTKKRMLLGLVHRRQRLDCPASPLTSFTQKIRTEKGGGEQCLNPFYKNLVQTINLKILLKSLQLSKVIFGW